MSDNICIFADGNNLFASARQLGMKVDYDKMLKLVTVKSEGYYTKAVFYTGSDDNAEKQRSFLHWMRRNGWRVWSKPVKQERDGSKSVSLTAEMITDIMLSVLNGAETVIIISGNEDFVYMLEKLQDRDIKIVVVGFTGSTSNKLINMADEFIALDRNIAKEGEDYEDEEEYVMKAK